MIWRLQNCEPKNSAPVKFQTSHLESCSLIGGCLLGLGTQSLKGSTMSPQAHALLMEFSCPTPVKVVVEGPTSSTELHNLTSNTEYLFSVLPVYESGIGEGLQGRATTGK